MAPHEPTDRRGDADQVDRQRAASERGAAGDRDAAPRDRQTGREAQTETTSD